MPVSRLRLRLAGGFALAFTVGLGVLAASGLGYLWRESTRRFDRHLDAVAGGVALALGRELEETPDSSLAFVAGEVAEEWPANGDAFVLLDSAGAVAAVRSDAESGAMSGVRSDSEVTVPRLLASVHAARWGSRGARRLRVERDGADVRARVLDTAVRVHDMHAAAATETTVHVKVRLPVRIVAYGSTEGIEADTELLAALLAIAAPLILIVSVTAGYLLAGRALRPVRRLSGEIASMAATDLSRRLAWSGEHDEVSTLAGEFDQLLARLDVAQQRNRKFVREAAHQIRTPLTLVLGEATHALGSELQGPADLRATLGRVRTAAEQMRRRVDELFLLAEAQAGAVVHLEEQVELDGLVLECTDLMRARAAATDHSLSIDRADPVVVLGSGALLQEALLELIENACRHGTPQTPIGVSCGTEDSGGEATLEVTSTGPDYTMRAVSDRQGGMGLSIVQWVATSHHGRFTIERDGSRNRARIVVPVSSG